MPHVDTKSSANPAAAIARRVDVIEQITQIGGRFQQFPVKLVESIDVALGKPLTRSEMVDDSHLTVLVEQTLELRSSSGNAEESTSRIDDADEVDKATDATLFRVAASFLILYRLKPGNKPSAEELEAFADQNGVFSVTPYWREFVSNCLSRAGLPPLMVPVMKVGEA